MIKMVIAWVAIALMLVLTSAGVAVAQDKPNIVIIWGDDVGQSDISAYTRGLMGFQTPDIDRVFLLVPAQAYVGRFLETFKEYPLRQEAATFTIDRVMEQLTPPAK